MTEPQDSTTTATDTCQGCGRDLFFDESAEVHRLADDPDAIFCGDGTDPHEPADYPDSQRAGYDSLVEPAAPVDAHLARARYLGADAALAAAASLTMSESDAADFLDGDGSHELRERYLSDGEPSLSGEWADDPTPYSLAVDILGMDGLAQHEDGEIAGRLTTAWEEGRDAVWPDAVTAFARRITGDIGGALALEASCEAYVDSLRRS